MMIKQGVVITEHKLAKLLMLKLSRIDSCREEEIEEYIKRRINHIIHLAYYLGYNDCIDDFNIKSKKLNPDLSEFILLESRDGGYRNSLIPRDAAIKSAAKKESIAINHSMLREIWLPISTVDLIHMRDDFTCRYCGGAANTIDHVFPQSKGGKTTLDNCVAACRTCNNEKGDKLL